MMGTLTTPTSASNALARSARRVSSLAACKARKPRYRNSRISADGSRASHTHQAPQVGLPQNAPVHRATNENRAPEGANALAIIDDRRVLKITPAAAHPAITM